MTEIADAIIAGIASEDTALEQMSAIMVNLERAGYVIVHAQQPTASGKVHTLKTWPPYFDDVLSGRKPFEWRIDDRDFAAGDTLVLQEYIPNPENPGREGKYTGREITRTVSYLFSPWPTNKRTVVMGLAASQSPAEGEPPNARNRIEARDKLIETLEAENTRLVSLVEGLQRRIASIDAPNIARALLQTERRRQIDVEGWTPGHDDEHEDGEMAQAASLYYRNTQHPLTMREDGAPLGWPWDARWWKPKDAHRDLVRAGALYLAEQERLRRLPGSGSLKRFRAAKYDKQIEQVVSALASLAVSSTVLGPVEGGK